MQLVSNNMDSAGGSCKTGRDKRTQAILASKGKLLNTSEKSVVQLMKDKDVHDLVTALGTGIGNEFNADKLDYHKVIILSDADVDGKHIDSLIVGFLWTHMRELIERGNVYLAKPPLFKLSKRDKTLGYADNTSELAKKLYSFISKHITGITVIDMNDIQHVLDAKSYFKMFEYLMEYRILLDTLHTNTGIPKNLLEDGFLGFESADDMLNNLEDVLMHASPNFFERKDNTIVSFYDGDYIEITLNEDMFTLLNDFNIAVENLTNKLPLVNKQTINGVLEVNIVYKDKLSSYNNNGAAEFLHVNSTKDIDVNYLKGLGELDPEQLWETTLDPENRVLVQLQMDNFEQCDDAVSLTLHSKHADLRKGKIQEFIAMQ